jgi:hypothetical protein
MSRFSVETIGMLDQLLPDLVEILKEKRCHRMSVYICADGRVDVFIEDANGRTVWKDRADTHSENEVHLDEGWFCKGGDL